MSVSSHSGSPIRGKLEGLLVLHQLALEQSGGIAGLRASGGLESALAKAQVMILSRVPVRLHAFIQTLYQLLEKSQVFGPGDCVHPIDQLPFSIE